MRSARTWPALAAALTGATAGSFVDLRSPQPTAEVARGSEEAFGRGFHRRQIAQPSTPVRWLRPESRFRFRRLPPGPAGLEVRLRQHASPVDVTANGRLLGRIEPGTTAARYELGEFAGGELEVSLSTEGTRQRGGRVLGARLERVRVKHCPPRLPSLRVVLAFAALGSATAWAATAAGVAPLAAATAGSAMPILAALALLPCGLLRSPYAERLGLELLAGLLLAVAFARACATLSPGAGPWAFAALLSALLVQGVAATSPMLLTSDAAFHANNVMRVASGEILLTSGTPHDPPFRVPYGSFFYALLVPFQRAGLDTLPLVRWGAAVSGVLASALLFLWLARESARLAGLAVVVLQLLPETFRYYSSGALSTVVGQSLTEVFFAWWAGTAPGGVAAGAAVLAAGGLTHLSALIVLTLLGAALLPASRSAPPDRLRARAFALGLAAAALYYVHYLDLIGGQLPRLLEGGAQGTGIAGPPLWRAFVVQGQDVFAGWGAPALLLAWLGRPRPAQGSLDRALAAFWTAGVVLFAIAVLTPLEVRYVHALTLPVAVASAHGLLALWARGRLGAAAAGLLLGLQGWLAFDFIAYALLERYRP